MDLHPSFAERIKAPRTEAQVRIARSQLSEVRSRWDEKDFDGARHVIDEMLELGATIPDRAFADEILTAGINEFARQIRNHKTEEGWEVLQKLITAARQRVEDDLQSGDEVEAQPRAEAGEEVPGLEKTPEPESMRESATEEAAEGQKSENEEGSSKQSQPPRRKREVREGPAAEYIRKVCRQAWGKQVRYLLGTGEYETAIDLLEFPDIEWFAERDLPRWRRRVYTSQAQSLRTKGQSHFKRHKWREAADCWKKGREAALLAEDDRVVESFDPLISDLLEAAPAETQAELRALLRDGDDREALRRCVVELEIRPGDARLTARRQALIKQLLSQIRDALKAQQWEEAGKITKRRCWRRCPKNPQLAAFSGKPRTSSSNSGSRRARTFSNAGRPKRPRRFAWRSRSSIPITREPGRSAGESRSSGAVPKTTPAPLMRLTTPTSRRVTTANRRRPWTLLSK